MGIEQKIIDNLNWNYGIPFGDPVVWHVTGSVTLPVVDLLGLTIEKIKKLSFARVKNLGSDLVELTGPLILRTSFSPKKHFWIKIMAAAGVTMFTIQICMPPIEANDIKSNIKRIAAFVLGVFGGIATFYLLGKLPLFNYHIEFFPPGTTFVKSSWWRGIEPVLPQS